MILKDVLMHYESYRLIHDNLDNLSNRIFWVLTLNSHIKESILMWCQVFGTRSNETHWKKAFKIASDTDDVLNKMLIDLKITLEDWEEHHSKMVLFRNDFVAHYKESYNEAVPFMEKSIAMCIAYDKVMRQELEKFDIIYDATITDYIIEGIMDIHSAIGKHFIS